MPKEDFFCSQVSVNTTRYQKAGIHIVLEETFLEGPKLNCVR
jgi:hypothetical protein